MKERLGILDQDYTSNQLDIDDEQIHALNEEEDDCMGECDSCNCHEDFSDPITANKALSKVAQDTINEFNSFIFVNTNDELIELVKNPSFMNKFENTEMGQYFLFENKAFFRTPDHKIQEAKAYVERLERTFLPYGQNLIEEITIKEHFKHIWLKTKIKLFGRYL